MDSKPLKWGLDSLPVEITRLILFAHTDILSLRSTVLTCSSVYNAFIGIRDEVTRRVVENGFTTDVRTEAALAMKSAHLLLSPTISGDAYANANVHANVHANAHANANGGGGGGDRQEVLLHQYSNSLLTRTIPSTEWTLRHAAPMSRLEIPVSYFAERFAADALVKYHHGGRGVRGSKSIGAVSLPAAAAPRSRTELARIKRAFYRFEIFCNLQRYARQRSASAAPAGLGPTTAARSMSSLPTGDMHSIFWARVSPVENEQLACVHDYFVRMIYPVFKRVIEQDSSIEKNTVDLSDSPGNPHIQRILSLGIEHLYTLARAIEANDEPRQRQLLLPWCLTADDKFIHASLKAVSGDYARQWFPGKNIQIAWIERSYPAYMKEEERGPLYVWREIHEHGNNALFDLLASNCLEPMRQMGYVIWDRARVEAMWDRNYLRSLCVYSRCKPK